MEISLDLPFIQGVIRQEYDLARKEIQAHGSSAALERSQARHDQRVASAKDVGTLACRAGCTWCCYFTVDVRAVEVFRILDFVERTFTREQKTRVYAEITANATAIHALDEDQRVRRTVKCPFLSDGRCSIYEARPQSCRNYHATNVAGCQKSFEEPENDDIDPDFAPYVYQAGTAHVDAFSTAMRDAGYDTNAYELSCAIEAARGDPSSRERFESRLPPFIGLSGEEVPLEFDDLAD